VRTTRYGILKRTLPIVTVLSALTVSSPDTLSAQEIEESEKTTIDFPVGRTLGKEKCFSLEAYKSLATIYAHYQACESQRHFVFQLMATVDEKQTALQESADKLTYSLATLENERNAYVVAATQNAEKAELEERYKRVWRGFAITGIVVSLALGAVLVVGVAK
jgi:hypothetical protein